MIRIVLLALALVIATPGLQTPPAEAQTQKKAEKKKAKPPGKGRTGYSAEERKRIQELARKVCKQKSGASSTVYRIDYKKLRVICMPPGS